MPRLSLVFGLVVSLCLQTGTSTEMPPLTMGQVLLWMDSGEESSRVAQLIERQGIDFTPTPEFIEQIHQLHAKRALLERLEGSAIKHSATSSGDERNVYLHLWHCLQTPVSSASLVEEAQCQAAESAEPSTAFFALGQRALSAKQYSAAQQFFRQAIAAAPSLPENHNYLGLAFQRAGDYKAAETAYREAVRLDPDYETPVCNLASLFLALNDLQRAESYARHAAVMPYSSAMAHHELGLALIRQSKAREGLAELRESVRLEPDSAFFHWQLAEMLLAGRVSELALQEFREASRIEPGNIATHERIFNLLLALGRGEEALSECETLSKLGALKEGKSCKDLVRAHKK